MPDALEVFDDVSIACDRAEQQTAFYCGAACCEMTLRTLGVTCAQADAYKLIHDDARFAVEHMYSDPEGLALCLNTKAPVGALQSKLEPLVTNDPQQIITGIYYTLKYLRIPCAVLVQKGNHWVVIDSARVHEAVGASPQVAGVFVENPWYGSPSDRYVAIDEFISGWLTGNQWGVTWKDKLVAISDGQACAAPTVANLPSAEASLLSAKWLTVNLPSTQPSPQERISAALSSHGFAQISEIQGGGADLVTPVLVHDLDNGGDFIVAPRDATQSPEFNNFVYVAIDAATYSLLEICQFARAVQVYSDDEAEIASKMLRPQSNIVVLGGYYWRRSFEAMSRFQIARKIEVDGAPLYLLSDGRLVDVLETQINAGA